MKVRQAAIAYVGKWTPVKVTGNGYAVGFRNDIEVIPKLLDGKGIMHVMAVDMKVFLAEGTVIAKDPSDVSVEVSEPIMEVPVEVKVESVREERAEPIEAGHIEPPRTVPKRGAVQKQRRLAKRS